MKTFAFSIFTALGLATLSPALVADELVSQDGDVEMSLRGRDEVWGSGGGQVNKPGQGKPGNGGWNGGEQAGGNYPGNGGWNGGKQPGGNYPGNGGWNGGKQPGGNYPGPGGNDGGWSDGTPHDEYDDGKNNGHDSIWIKIIKWKAYCSQHPYLSVCSYWNSGNNNGGQHEGPGGHYPDPGPLPDNGNYPAIIFVDGVPYPACSSYNSDPDGDGWGWEYAQTCRVPFNGPKPAPTHYPTCYSSASDPDHDGWGWENGQSCQVRY